MLMAQQASKAALCATVLLLVVLLALSGVMLGDTVLAGQSLWGSRAQAGVEPGQPCGGPSSAGQVLAIPELERPTLNSSHIQQDLTHQGETPC
ncbi:hypothetical protein [Pseudomonas sp.]|uniref:hypothetical protein n=1 Tax=Pseudomonas sp. TaxID=306 RepID=UPI00299D931B|nr:hypothetical protein [Pseudomonas sp.]MDX1367563.1 hypothetical protein [Pseudomonas sp.]